MKGWWQPRDPVRDARPRNDWIWFFAVLLIVAALYAGLR